MQNQVAELKGRSEFVCGGGKCYRGSPPKNGGVQLQTGGLVASAIICLRTQDGAGRLVLSVRPVCCPGLPSCALSLLYFYFALFR